MTAGRRWLAGVCGSASLAEDAPEWADARRLGRLLAEAGWDVLTGGYDGLMGAVSRGANEAGGHVVGVPMRGWDHLAPNRWVSEARWVEDELARLREFSRCDALVVLRGGSGTMAEMAVTWTNAGTWPPLLLVGPEWAEVVATFRRLLVTRPGELERLVTVPTIEAAVSRLATFTPAADHGSGAVG